jgi:hypothetical protein
VNQKSIDGRVEEECGQVVGAKHPEMINGQVSGEALLIF